MKCSKDSLLLSYCILSCIVYCVWSNGIYVVFHCFARALSTCMDIIRNKYVVWLLVMIWHIISYRYVSIRAYIACIYKVWALLYILLKGYLTWKWATLCYIDVEVIKIEKHNDIWETWEVNSFGRIWWPWKRPKFVVGEEILFNLRIRTGSCLGVWGHRQHPWRLLSSSWHAQCRWRHHGWHSPRKPWVHLWSPHRWVLRYVLHHLYGPDDGWQAWWYPGCYLWVPSCASWHPPFRDPFHLYHVQTSC